MFQANSDLFSNAKVKGLYLIHLLQFSKTLVRVFISGSARRKIAEHINLKNITRYLGVIFFLQLVSPVDFLNFGYFCNAAKKITENPCGAQK